MAVAETKRREPCQNRYSSMATTAAAMAEPFAGASSSAGCSGSGTGCHAASGIAAAEA